ncbi:uncharacterized protein LOC113230850 [Hyposmocoma kahamanoa]|uniref:uncharacterized protein LOC113230850 n=1 Tax=Hyposmocoma kahamanoa TaxID=1477025 RepID=UPI000E6D6C49|nr:uncharacterized protein LOC113230850 [Hyposmocoma kahamanoa]
MNLKTRNRRLSGNRKSFKLAGEGIRRGRNGLLVDAPFYTEREDSGIDSDDAAYRGQWPICNGRGDASDQSGSEEEPIVKQPWMRGKTNEQIFFKARAEQQQPESDHGHDVLWELKRIRQEFINGCDHLDTDRGSSPLFEIELTASDEDDDTSVLELVIPMQPSKYQRVPTSSPMKAVPVAPTFFCNMFCCLRK